MTNEDQITILSKVWSQLSLKAYSLQAVSYVLFQLNDSNIGPEFPWLTSEQNPFIGIPPTVLEEIVDDVKDPLARALQSVQKELLQVLLCKRMKKIDLSFFIMKEEDVLPILKIVAATQSDLRHFDVEILDDTPKPLCWSNILPARNFLTDYIKTLSSLTYLNVTGACDDKMLEAIGASCPNLVVLVATSEKITSEGLKMLCMNTRDPDDHLKRCQKLQKISLDIHKEYDHLMEGVESLLLNLPQLRVLEWPTELLGKVIEKIYSETKDLPTFHLQEFIYNGLFPYSSLPSVIAKTCPFLKSLKIWNASNLRLQQFECIECLRSVTIGRNDNSANFNDGIAPFLQRMGKNLEALALQGFEEVNFNVIDENCPNLRRLECNCMGQLSGKVTVTPLFKNLEDMRLSSYIGTGLQAMDCVRILSKCFNLRCLTLYCCDDLNKNHIKMILLRNPLSNLLCAHISSTNMCIQGTLSDLKSICER